jgi:glutamate racemase
MSSPEPSKTSARNLTPADNNAAVNIVVFDSGKGAYFVEERLNALQRKSSPILRNYQIVVDRKNVPYGSKSALEVQALTEKALLPWLNRTEKADVITIACNTATALAIDFLRSKYPEQKFVGFEPMVKPATKNSETGEIAVLATPATLQSERYLRLKSKYASEYQVYEPDCSAWAKRIEDGTFGTEDLAELKSLVKQTNIDQIILACTHYLGIEELLREQLPDTIVVLQPMQAIDKQIERLLNA